MTHAKRDIGTWRAIPTQYAGHTFRSRLEADVAYLLDAMRLPWEYEPTSLLLPNGTHYMPDFYVPSLRLVVEARGYDSPKGQRQASAFTDLVTAGRVAPGPTILAEPPKEIRATNFADYAVIGHGQLWAEACQLIDGPELIDDLYIALCGECFGWYFIGDGHLECRACGANTDDGPFGHIAVFFEPKVVAGTLGLYRPGGLAIPRDRWRHALNVDGDE